MHPTLWNCRVELVLPLYGLPTKVAVVSNTIRYSICVEKFDLFSPIILNGKLWSMISLLWQYTYDQRQCNPKKLEQQQCVAFFSPRPPNQTSKGESSFELPEKLQFLILSIVFLRMSWYSSNMFNACQRGVAVNSSAVEPCSRCITFCQMLCTSC